MKAPTPLVHQQVAPAAPATSAASFSPAAPPEPAAYLSARATPAPSAGSIPHAAPAAPADPGARAATAATPGAQPRVPGQGRRAGAGAVFRLILFLALMPLLFCFSVLAFYLSSLEHRIYPRVHVSGVDLGGQTREAAYERLRRHVDHLAQQPLVLRYDGDALRTTLGTAGLILPDENLMRVVDQAWHAGRATTFGGWLQAQRALLWRGTHLPLPLAVDQDRAHALFGRVAAQLDVSPLAARLELVKLESGVSVRSAPAQPGRRVDVEATMRAFGAALATGVPPATLDLRLEATAPPVTDADVAAAEARLTALLGGPLTFRRDDGQVWMVQPATLVDAITVDASIAPVAIDLDEETLRCIVFQAVGQADQPALNPRLEVRDGQVVLLPGRSGRLVEREIAFRDSLAQLNAGTRTVDLAMVDDHPWLDERALHATRDWANTRLALPLTIDFEGQRRTLDRRDLAGLLSLPDTQALPRPASQTEPRRTPQMARAPATAPMAGPARASGAPVVGDWPDLEVALDPAKVRDFLVHATAGWAVVNPEHAPRGAALEVRNDRVEIHEGQSGIGIDFAAAARDFAVRFASTDPADRVVALPLVHREPQITEALLLPARDAANRLTGAPVVVRSWVDEWTITPAELRGMLEVQVERDAAGVPVEVRPHLGRDRLVERIAAIARQAEGGLVATGIERAGSGTPPWRVDVLATAAEVEAAAQSDDPDDRTATLQWHEYAGS